MATFIEEAKALLTEEKFNRLELLRVKSNNFESTLDEEKEFFAIKEEVRTLISQRDKDKNLQFLADPSIALVDILRVKKATKEEINKAVKTLFPPVTDLTEIVAVIPYKDKKGKDAVAEIRFGTGGSRLDRQANAEIIKIGVKGFLKHLTEYGKAWIVEKHIADRGPYAGTEVYDNVPKVCLRFKFKPEELKKELKI